MLEKINKGDTLECLNCKHPIQCNEETMTLDMMAEYIYCPSCNKYIDIQNYHMFGTLIGKGD